MNLKAEQEHAEKSLVYEGRISKLDIEIAQMKMFKIERDRYKLLMDVSHGCASSL